MYAIEAGSLSTRLIKEVNFDDAIEAGSLVEQGFRHAIEAGSLSTGSSKRSTLTAPLKQAHFRTSSLFRHAIEAGSLSTGSLKRSTSNDDAGYFESAQLLHELLMTQVI